MFSKPPGRSGKALSKLRNRMNMEYLRRDGSASMFGPLTVNMADYYNAVLCAVYAAGAEFPIIGLVKSDSSTLGTLAETDDGDDLGHFIWQGVNSSSVASTAAYIRAVQNGAAGATYIPADIAFFTATDAAAPTERMRIATDGRVDIGADATPTAWLQLPAGLATAGFAPLKFISGTALTTAEAGTVEYHNDRFYITNVANRRAIDRTSDVIVATTTVANTTTETTIYTATIAAGDLKVGNIIKGTISGVLSNNSAADDITIRLKLAGTTLVTFNPAIGNVSGADWHMEGHFTVRTVGAGGTLAGHIHLVVDGHESKTTLTGAIDTTANCDFTVTVEWDNAKSDNTISIYNGFVEYKG